MIIFLGFGSSTLSTVNRMDPIFASLFSAVATTEPEMSMDAYMNRMSLFARTSSTCLEYMLGCPVVFLSISRECIASPLFVLAYGLLEELSRILVMA